MVIKLVNAARLRKMSIHDKFHEMYTLYFQLKERKDVDSESYVAIKQKVEFMKTELKLNAPLMVQQAIDKGFSDIDSLFVLKH